jgi:glycosyltransferase involved in cell wall biosynthesis
VEFVGEVPYGRFLRYMEIADVFVLSSRDEALPMTILTAMSYGKPIISTEVGGIAEVIEHEVHGLLIESEDAKALRSNLLRLFEDLAFAQQLGEAARERFEERLTFERFGESMLDVIEGIVDHRDVGS